MGKIVSVIVIPIVTLISLGVGCSNTIDTSPRGTGQGFHYQLQDATIKTLSALDEPIAVVDIDDASLTKQELQTLKESGKTILSYLSIGEAEQYRTYWKENWKVSTPSFIDAENPDWEGNYKVRYWDQEWQSIIFTQLDAIVATGYHGVYLDIIDGYEYYTSEPNIDAAQEMVAFVAEISKRAKAKNPNFLVIPQNAPELYTSDIYQKAIDGFGKEDTWFDGDKKQKTMETTTTLKYLKQALADGKLIVAIDYPTRQKNICSFYTLCQEAGFYCTVSNRDLSLPSPTVCAP
ncbi:MAG: hypothetical protein COU33_00340 [Candidatus Magasanikbacteria bacterium CG10_big_fil_rev_8_21_14_0_10_43_6]|uniref:Glycoside-hydrolase family GH114 TIM-barrel domain-containing protein n=1 Tax=Candidatus Magasanikbacteria bacterium CG10_big_fil_rev_8_21_14_0_10_43_6 TaxID=1974650 RepID=A0A2M6W2D6_9BACT|nr:MAG: hypothetical protein COU33_00340 [Candidatus Magasanikbacteria bacterium CG10_big_fil_rev_8_21_14_0_10_43_6]